MKNYFYVLIFIFFNINSIQCWCNKNHKGDCYLSIRGGHKDEYEEDTGARGINFLEDHGYSSFGKISAYPTSPEDTSLSQITLTVRDSELKFFSDGTLRAPSVHTGSLTAEAFTLVELELNNQWHIKDAPIIEGGEVIEGLRELVVQNEETLNDVMRISNQAKKDSLVISEESFVGLGTKWPSVKLDVNGGVQGTSAYSAASDRRLKANIENINEKRALAVIKSLEGVEFDWKDDIFSQKKFDFEVKRNPGFIAQEVEAVLPQIVTEGRDGYKSVQYAGVIPYLVQTIKLLDSRIKELEATVL